MFKKLFVVAIAAAGALAIQRKVRDQRAEQELWAEVTDDVRTSGGAGGTAAPAS